MRQGRGIQEGRASRRMQCQRGKSAHITGLCINTNEDSDAQGLTGASQDYKEEQCCHTRLGWWQDSDPEKWQLESHLCSTAAEEESLTTESRNVSGRTLNHSCEDGNPTTMPWMSFVVDVQVQKLLSPFYKYLLSKEFQFISPAL